MIRLAQREGQVELPSSRSLPLQIEIEGPRCENSRVGLRARNQHAAYWNARPPPTVELRVDRIDGRTRVPVPFAVESSGGGGSGVRADLLIREPDEQRRAKLREHAELFVAFSRKRLGAEVDADPGDLRARHVEVLDLQYQYAPPAFYEVSAKYTPHADAGCPGVLESESLGIAVYEAGSSLTAMRDEMEAALTHR